MKIALCNEMFQNWSLENQFEAFAAWGYDGVELAPFSLDPEFVNRSNTVMTLSNIDASIRRKIVSCSRATGIVVSGLHWILAKTSGYHLTTPDASIRKRTAEYLSELVELCAELGGSYMVLGSPNQRNIAKGQTREEAEQNALDTVSQVLPALEKHNVVLALESLAPTETNFWITSEETLDFIESLGSPKNVTLHLDCKAMHGGEYRSMPEVIKSAAERKPFVSFHANDPNLQGPGFGRLDFQPILESLREVGFDGWIGIEPFDYSPGNVNLGRESIRYLKKFSII